MSFGHVSFHHFLLALVFLVLKLESVPPFFLWQHASTHQPLHLLLHLELARRVLSLYFSPRDLHVSCLLVLQPLLVDTVKLLLASAQVCLHI